MKNIIFILSLFINFLFADMDNICPKFEFQNKSDILCPIGYQTVNFDYSNGVVSCQSNDNILYTDANSHICKYTNYKYVKYIETKKKEGYNKGIVTVEKLEKYQNSENVQQRIKEQIDSINPVPFDFTSLLTGVLLMDDSKIATVSENGESTIFIKDLADNKHTAQEMLTTNIKAQDDENQDIINLNQAITTFFSYVNDGLSFYVSTMTQVEDILSNVIILIVIGFSGYYFFRIGYKEANDLSKGVRDNEGKMRYPLIIMHIVLISIFSASLPTNLVVENENKDTIQHNQTLIHTAINYSINQSLDVANKISQAISKNFTYYQAKKFGLDDYKKYAKFKELESYKLAVNEISNLHLQECSNNFVFRNTGAKFDITVVDSNIQAKTKDFTIRGNTRYKWHGYYYVEFPEINEYTCSKVQNTNNISKNEANMYKYAFESSIEGIKRASNNSPQIENTIVQMAYQNEVYRQTFGFAYTPILPALDMFVDLASVNSKFNTNDPNVKKILLEKKVYDDYLSKNSEIETKIYQHILSNTTDYVKKANENWNNDEYIEWAKNKVNSVTFGDQQEQTKNTLIMSDVFANLGKFAPVMIFGGDIYNFFANFFDSIGAGSNDISGFFVGLIKRAFITNTSIANDIKDEFNTGVGLDSDSNIVDVLTVSNNSAFKFVFSSVMTYKVFYYVLETVPLAIVLILGFYYIVIFFKDVIIYKFASMIVVPLAVATGEYRKIYEFVGKLIVLLLTPILLAFIIFLIIILKMLLSYVYMILVNMSIAHLFSLSSSFLLENIDSYSVVGLAMSKFGYNFFTTTTYIVTQIIFTLTAIYLLRSARENIMQIIGVKTESMMQGSMGEVANKVQSHKL